MLPSVSLIIAMKQLVSFALHLYGYAAGLHRRNGRVKIVDRDEHELKMLRWQRFIDGGVPMRDRRQAWGGAVAKRSRSASLVGAAIFMR